MNSSTIDPICGMKGKIPAHGQMFCSLYCVRKFETENNLVPMQEEILCPPQQKSGKFGFLFWVAVLVSALFGASFFVEILYPFQHHFLMYARMVALPLAGGLIIGGLIEVYVPRSYITTALAGRSFKTLLNAAFAGIIFSGCSHGCLAIAIQLFKKGASVPAVITFLLASPWTNVAITLLLLKMLGLKGLAIILLAIVVAITTGAIFFVLDRKGLIEKNPAPPEIWDKGAIFNDIRRRWNEYHFNAGQLFREDFPQVLAGTRQLADMVLAWILTGMTIASVIGAYVPMAVFENYLGGDFRGLCATLAGATVIEICSEGSAPIAFEIYQKTHALGNTFVFLMAGVVTDYTEIGLLWTNVGKRTALWLPAVSVPLVFALGLLLNALR